MSTFDHLSRNGNARVEREQYSTIFPSHFLALRAQRARINIIGERSWRSDITLPSARGGFVDAEA